jgi:GTP-binding protein EngB required for normal cell division
MDMKIDKTSDSLNSFQKRHLQSICEYVDGLLTDMESILAAAASQSAFQKYKNDVSPAQRKVVADYLSRIRAQMIRVLESQDLVPDVNRFGAAHALRVTLIAAQVALEDLAPKAMRGYGQVLEGTIQDLNGIVNELQGLAQKLSKYLSQGLGQDLQGRLARLEQTCDGIGLLKLLERIITDQGLVEFRPGLSVVVDHLERNDFEIALFGRVSSGKSSLLNHILQSDVLPVGVTPITAVPTRIKYGTKPRLTVWFANKEAEQHNIERLPEYVSELENSGNTKHVTRIVLEYPSPRLSSGVIFVDTPGLGSLATSGAAETLAYLPRCDLGVVLIDAGSTLTQEDLSTIGTLYQAAIPAMLLLSKADLLDPGEQVQSLKYISDPARFGYGRKYT